MAEERLVVAASRIHGEGVFARVRFGKGERIIAIDDSRVVTADKPLRPDEGEIENRCDDLAGGKVVYLPPPHFTNHSCEPNSFVRTIGGARYRIALRDIEAGEEITPDYCINSRGDVVWECNCASPRCRRTIHSDFFRLPVALQIDYLPLLDGWFVEENQELVEALQERADG